ncbi:DUF6879 family protein [Streptomyces antibioticus]|uniref:DUF6879 family protein n=1 Tax=Streptomyces antibioticus TaxID=1890 RepID=UPI0036DA0938
MPCLRGQRSAVHLETRGSHGVAAEAEALARWKESGTVDADLDSPYWVPWTQLARRTVAP